MKIPARGVESFVRGPDPKMRAVLVYGPDLGLIAERLDRMTRAVVPDPADPFRITELPAAGLKDDPARLADEAAALAFGGGRRVVRIRDAGDSVTAVFEGFLEHPAGDALVLVQAGELPPRSSLRKLFENAANGAALPCYADDEAGVEAVVAETLRAAGLTAEPAAMGWLIAHLGGDRRLTRAELDKLVTYMGGPGKIALADVVASVGDAAGLSLDDLSLAVADGEQAGAQDLLGRLLLDGTQPVQILRSVARHFQRLHLAAGLVARGQAPAQAIEALKPPVIFHQKDRLRAQLQRWDADRLAHALDILVEAEIGCKTTGMPAPELCGRALMRLARAAAGARRR
ncbi:MAG: DNA polymerase III subunit delta [Alphaproteobacteria bacterium]|nr:DNA polymerase III subunit delta [Alphaproteobacteria bacterium]